MHLSDAFEKAGFLGLPEKTVPSLELELRVININEGRKEGGEENREECTEEIVRNALAEGLPMEIIQKITGLDTEAIKNCKRP